MKCPKCGFNSFEFHDNCKKCGISLESFKMDLNIKPVVFSADRPLPEKAQSSAVEAKAPLAGEESGDTFTWDTPESDDTQSSSDANFSGFELDFLKQDEKADIQGDDFFFDRETVSQPPAQQAEENAMSPEDFSFYEETIDPGQDQLFDGSVAESAEEVDSLFGESGVIGEILPEKLQDEVGELDPADIIDDTSPEGESYEKEFDFGAFSIKEDEKENKNCEVKKTSADFTDFEKEFESIFQTEE
jgi:hypothetical protein